jgi:hypothetical protein
MAKNKLAITIEERFELVNRSIENCCNWTTTNPYAKSVWIGCAIKHLEILQEIVKCEMLYAEKMDKNGE